MQVLRRVEKTWLVSLIRLFLNGVFAWLIYKLQEALQINKG